MFDLFSDVITGGVAVAAAWVLLSVPFALVLGRMVRVRDAREEHTR
ncbi:hypothetical protein [Subtercola sp. Z020]|nr:hypothetical protein [Subtercola sp. Z020]